MVNVTLAGEATRARLRLESWTLYIRATGKLALATGCPEASRAVITMPKGVSAVGVVVAGLTCKVAPLMVR